MSDGNYSFPSQAVSLHKSHATFQKKLEFYSVCFGSGGNMKILKQIADEMPNGKLVKELSAKELTESSKKVEINFYKE